MLRIVRTPQFNGDLSRLRRQDYALEELVAVIQRLAVSDEEPLSVEFIIAHSVHPLHGEWAGKMDLHLEGDWLLIYEVEGNELRLIRTGTHADLFRSWRDR